MNSFTGGFLFGLGVIVAYVVCKLIGLILSHHMMRIDHPVRDICVNW